MNKNFIDFILKRPHFVFSLILSLTLLGVIGLFNIKQKLFPDVNRPQIAVVIVERGASAKDLAENVAIPVEKQLYTLDKVRKVSSSIKDEVAVISVEFDYGKDIGEAATDVQNEINKIKSLLPKDIKEPQIYKITDATQPVLVISVSAKNNDIPLADLRQFVENKIKDELLKLPDVANVDVFGGYKKNVLILVDRDKLNRYGLSLSQVLSKIQQTIRGIEGLERFVRQILDVIDKDPVGNGQRDEQGPQQHNRYHFCFVKKLVFYDEWSEIHDLTFCSCRGGWIRHPDTASSPQTRGQKNRLWGN